MRSSWDVRSSPEPRLRGRLIVSAAVTLVVAAVVVVVGVRVLLLSTAVFADAPSAARPQPTAVAPGVPAVVPARPSAVAALPTVAPSPTAAPEDPSILGKLRAGKRVSVLLIGYGGADHDGVYLTDSLVVVTFEPESGQLTMFNLPRDLLVRAAVPGKGLVENRINEFYTLGMGSAGRAGTPGKPSDHDRAAWLLAGIAEQVLGVPVDGWISADFAAVRRVVDGLGGVVVNVERAFDDYAYPANDNSAVDDGVIHVHFDRGPQRLSGERALQFARSRLSEQDGGDFARSRRQQLLLLALKDQVLTPSALPRLWALMDAVQGHLRTSLTLTEAKELALYAQSRREAIVGVRRVLDTRELLVGTMTEEGASVLVPKAGRRDYREIHKFVRQALGTVRPARLVE